MGKTNLFVGIRQNREEIMNTFFISTACKKDLQRIKKILIRDEIDYTLNSKHLFIICYTFSFHSWTKRQITDNNANITQVNLHNQHPKLKESINENLAPLPFAQ